MIETNKHYQEQPNQFIPIIRKNKLVYAVKVISKVGQNVVFDLRQYEGRNIMFAFWIDYPEYTRKATAVGNTKHEAFTLLLEKMSINNHHYPNKIIMLKKLLKKITKNPRALYSYNIVEFIP